LDQDVAVVPQPRNREVHGALERLRVIERGRQLLADVGEKRQAIARRDAGKATSMSTPSLRRRTDSNGSMRSPARMRLRTWSSSWNRSGGMMIVIDWPIASAAEL